MEKFLRLTNVKETTGLSRSTIYQFVREGQFPNAVKLGPRAVGWRASDIAEWMNSRRSARVEAN